MSQLIGANIDPRLFVQDYSGYADAARIQSAGIAGAANTIAGSIADYAKEQKASKNALKSSQVKIDAAIKLFPDQAGYLSTISNELKNEDVPLSERAAIASGISEMIMMGVDQSRYSTELGFKRSDQNMKEQGFQVDQQIRGLQWDAAEQDRSSQKAQQEARNMITPEVLEATINMIQATPATSGMFTPEFIDKARTATPDTQAAILKTMQDLLPAKQKAELVKDLPVTIDGQPGTTAAMVDPTTGRVSPLIIDLPEGVEIPADGSLLPPKPGQAMDAGTAPGDIQTDSGEVIPANEAKLLGEDAEAAVWNYQGRIYMQTKSPVPVESSPGMSLGRVNVTPSTPEQIQAAKFAAEDQAAKVKERNTALGQAQAAKGRVLKTIDKYMDAKTGKPTTALTDAVGWGEGLASGVRAFTGIPLNTPQTVANQKQLQLDLLEQSILEASKALKPVSNDEMKMLKANRPEIADPPEVWTQYMQSVKAILADPANYQDNAADSRQRAANRLTELNPGGQ